MKDGEIVKKVWSSCESMLKEKNYISPVEILMRVGVLSDKDYRQWRYAKVPYLEIVCKANLRKMSLIMKELGNFARLNKLKPSHTVYAPWGSKSRKKVLRFSKSGNPNIEKHYSTHYVKRNIEE
ncbi:MAG: hypothetical protein GX166_07830 [Clostridiaceae bacterium]|nr:hypothetical protein [Clostridiaceae bacterium]